MRALCRDVAVAEPVLRYASRLVRASDPTTQGAPDVARRALRFGAGVRGGQSLVLAAKAVALLDGRAHVAFGDMQRVAKPVPAPPPDPLLRGRGRRHHHRSGRRGPHRGRADPAGRRREGHRQMSAPSSRGQPHLAAACAALLTARLAGAAARGARARAGAGAGRGGVRHGGLDQPVAQHQRHEPALGLDHRRRQHQQQRRRPGPRRGPRHHPPVRREALVRGVGALRRGAGTPPSRCASPSTSSLTRRSTSSWSTRSAAASAPQQLHRRRFAEHRRSSTPRARCSRAASTTRLSRSSTRCPRAAAPARRPRSAWSARASTRPPAIRILPDRAALYDAADAVLFRSDMLAKVSGPELEALAGYVLGGGTLAIALTRPEDVRNPDDHRARRRRRHPDLGLVAGAASARPRRAAPVHPAATGAARSPSLPARSSGTMLGGFRGGNLHGSVYGSSAPLRPRRGAPARRSIRRTSRPSTTAGPGSA